MQPRTAQIIESFYILYRTTGAAKWRERGWALFDAVAAHAAWFGSKVRELVKAHSYVLDGVPGRRLDLVGNVTNLAPVHWVAELLVRRVSLCLGRRRG